MTALLEIFNWPNVGGMCTVSDRRQTSRSLRILPQCSAGLAASTLPP